MFLPFIFVGLITAIQKTRNHQMSGGVWVFLLTSKNHVLALREEKKHTGDYKLTPYGPQGVKGTS